MLTRVMVMAVSEILNLAPVRPGPGMMAVK